jgi:RimJ/RimL family protein N-acetyltransferase
MDPRGQGARVTPLATERLWLVPFSRELCDAGLRSDDATVRLTTGDGPVEVHVGADWPLDLKPMLGAFVDAFDRGEQITCWCVVEKATRAAVGDCGTKGGPDADGRVDIGYGFVPGGRGRGLAAEAVGAVVAHLLAGDDDDVVAADTAVDNAPSQRVLERNDFRRVGTGWDEEDGDLIRWERA